MKYPPFTADEQIHAIARGLIDRTLPKERFTHAAHFASALWLLSSVEHDAFVQMPGLIRAYNESVGGQNTDTAGYHETITVASLRGARAFLNAAREAPLYVTCNALLASPLGDSGWPLRHWRRETLFSVEARRRWVDPDLLRLPF